MIKRLALLTTLLVASIVLFFGSQDTVIGQACNLRATTGAVEWIRVNEVGTGYGPPTDFIDGEVIFKLKGINKRFGFQMRTNANALVAQGALSLLQDALFTKNWRVEVDYNDCGGSNHMVGAYRVRLFKPVL